MESTVKQRLMEFIDYKEISIREFERTCGLSYGYINNSIRVDILNRKVIDIVKAKMPNFAAGHFFLSSKSKQIHFKYFLA